ncbi:MAG TPA: type II toxin-antitoxin system mRNA interferase toxin, RelE/StbE family [Candidatus Atribacteria bacterium]|nr:type II toxin-antitoxin system mRNA interferase toxin, RelE/StbE family [Candidatus Atribacteria bacterium]
MAFSIQKIVFDAYFERRFNEYKRKLSEKELQRLKERIKIFKQNPFDQRLKTHKLKGNLKDYWVFSITYSDRILFRFLEKGKVFFIDIGNHSIYK